MDELQQFAPRHGDLGVAPHKDGVPGRPPRVGVYGSEEARIMYDSAPMKGEGVVIESVRLKDKRTLSLQQV
ncbi:hypothetical protein D3C73_1525580 [compost metagenome]